MHRTSSALTLLAVALVAGNLRAELPVGARVQGIEARLGLRSDNAMQVSRTHQDGAVAVHHMQQYHRGLKVWGAQTNLREEGGEMRVAAKRVFNDINIAIEPTFTASEVCSFVDNDLNTWRPLSLRSQALEDEGGRVSRLSVKHLSAPATELVILPIQVERVLPSAAHKRADQLNAEDVEYVVTGYRLAYHVATDAQVRGQREMMNYLVDAHSGEIIRKWNMVKRGAVAGTVNTKYSGAQTLYTNYTGSTYQALDPIYYNNYVSSSTSSSTPYTDADNVWGNGGNYADGTTVAKQTGAAEALLVLQREAQMLKAVWGRNGSSGTSKAMKVVWGQYAASNTACYITNDYIISGYADSYFYDMNKYDILGHEYGHSFDYYTAGLCMSDSGEAGGMAEAHADIMGLLTEVYGKYSTNDPNNPATTIPEEGLTDPKTWICGEDAAKSVVNGGKGLRFFIKPSWDTMEGTIDAWKSSMSTVEVHAAAGPTDRMFYYLAVGAPASSSHDGYTSYLPNGSTGVGLHKAAEIWVRTILSGQLSSSSTHLNARNACIATATSLYGATSPEVSAVKNAYAGINVGQADQGVTVAITPATASLTTNGTQQFTATVSGTTNSSVTWSCTGGTVTTSGYYTAPATAGTFTVTATSAADTTKKATATVTVTAPAAPTITTQPANKTVALGSTASFSVVASGSGLSYQWYKNGTAISGATAASYTTPATTSADNGATFYVKVTNTVGSVTSNTATLTVTTSVTYNEVESNGSISAANAVPDSATKVVGYISSRTDLDYFKVTVAAGHTLTVKMTGPAKDYDLYLYNASGTQLAKSTGSSSTETVTYTNSGSAAVTYVIKVLGYNKAYTTSTPYNLAISR